MEDSQAQMFDLLFPHAVMFIYQLNRQFGM